MHPSLCATPHTGGLRSRRRGTWSKRTKRCLPQRRRCSNERWRRLTRRTPATVKLRHLPVSSNSCFLLHFLSFLHVLIKQRQRPSCQDIHVTNVSILHCLKMGPVQATEGKPHQTKRYTCCRCCVKGNGARVGASDDGKWTNDGAIR
jgi:hypothetical protein